MPASMTGSKTRCATVAVASRRNAEARGNRKKEASWAPTAAAARPRASNTRGHVAAARFTSGNIQFWGGDITSGVMERDSGGVPGEPIFRDEVPGEPIFRALSTATPSGEAMS